MRGDLVNSLFAMKLPLKIERTTIHVAVNIVDSYM